MREAVGDILIVDDDELVLLNLREQVERAGYRTVVTSRYYAALQALHHLPIHVLVTDLSLPDGRGEELATRATRAGIRVILMSGRPPLGDMAAGWIYLGKPVAPAELIRAIERSAGPHRIAV